MPRAAIVDKTGNGDRVKNGPLFVFFQKRSLFYRTREVIIGAVL